MSGVERRLARLLIVDGYSSRSLLRAVRVRSITRSTNPMDSPNRGGGGAWVAVGIANCWLAPRPPRPTSVEKGGAIGAA